MKTPFAYFVFFFTQLLLGAAPAPAFTLLKDLNSTRDFPQIASRYQWQERAQAIREQVLVSCGLWPSPEKTPLNAHVFGRIERNGYSVEKVYLQTLPGFYLGGNLYRPLHRGKGPFPGILNPHGHWSNGRMADTKDGSIPARCIGFARQGMVAFSYDMVGFNDTHFSDTPTNRPFYEVHRQFATNRTDLLWNISLMGLQTWNSVRALDFLQSLTEVDPKRLACTGESGGGTQTYILGAIEPRLAAQAPVVMVSHTMQGGCLCENAPGLRVEYSNMEIAAAPAPRPQILVAATGDWTKDTLTVEGPAIAHIYQLFNAPEKFRYVRFDYGHNYNQTSREAVYEWFGKWLLKHPDPASLKEAAYEKEPDADLRVFPDGCLPADAVTQEQFIASLRHLHQRQWQALADDYKKDPKKFRQMVLPLWRHILQVDWPISSAQARGEQPATCGDFTAARVKIGRAADEPAIAATYWAPPGLLASRFPRLVVLCSSEGEARPLSGEEVPQGQKDSQGHAATNGAAGGPTAPTGLVLKLLERGLAVLLVDPFGSEDPVDQFANFYSTYNRTQLQERVRDLLTVCAAAPSVEKRKELSFRLTLVGTGRAGLWALLAAPAAAAVIADCTMLDPANEQQWLAPDLFCPGILTMGGFEAAAMLAAPHPLLLHGMGAHLPTANLSSTYKFGSNSAKLRLETAKLADDQLANWIAQNR